MLSRLEHAILNDEVLGSSSCIYGLVYFVSIGLRGGKGRLRMSTWDRVRGQMIMMMLSRVLRGR